MSTNSEKVGQPPLKRQSEVAFGRTQLPNTNSTSAVQNPPTVTMKTTETTCKRYVNYVTFFVVLLSAVSIVTGSITLHTFVKLDGSAKIEGSPGSVLNTRSRIQCSDRCAWDPLCEAYQYSNQGNNRCQVILSSHGNSENFTSTDNDVIYRKDYSSNVNECESMPCEHAGSCIDGIDSYTCECTTGYTGDRCETNIDECESMPCEHGGSYIHAIDSYSCECTKGYIGERCETNIDECESMPCEHGGSCINGIDSYTCECTIGYTGQRCETIIDGCESMPCEHGGSCINGVNSYTCECTAGYSGDRCEINIDECSSNPCQNGGTCEDGVNSYKCQCTCSHKGHLCHNAACPYSRNWTAPSGWTTGVPAVYWDFETDDCTQYHRGAQRVSGKVSYGASTNMADRQYVDLCDLSSLTCLSDPGSCTSGFSLAFWRKIIRCEDGDGILSTRPKDRTGLSVFCKNDRGSMHIRYTMWIKEAWFKVQMPWTLDWVFVTVIYRGYRNGLTVYHNAQNPSTDPSAQSGKGYSHGPRPLMVGRKFTDIDDKYSSVIVDEVIVWDNMLSESEVISLMNVYL